MLKKYKPAGLLLSVVSSLAALIISLVLTTGLAQAQTPSAVNQPNGCYGNNGGQFTQLDNTQCAGKTDTNNNAIATPPSSCYVEDTHADWVHSSCANLNNPDLSAPSSSSSSSSSSAASNANACANDTTACSTCGQQPAGSTTSCVNATCTNNPSLDPNVQKQTLGNNLCTSCTSGYKPSDGCGIVQRYIDPLVNFMAAAVGLIVTAMIIVGGIQYSSAGGDPQKVAAAKKRIFNAIFALVAFGLLYAVLSFILPGGLGK